MKKRKIPRWLSRAAALVGILAVLVSSLLVPVSAAVYAPDGSIEFRNINGFSVIEFIGIDDTADSNYGSGVHHVVYDTCQQFYLGETTTGYYNKYPLQTLLSTSAGVHYSDWINQVNVGNKITYSNTNGVSGSYWSVKTNYRFHSPSGIAAGQQYPTPTCEEIVFRIDDVYLLRGELDNIVANKNNGSYNFTKLPSINAISGTGSTQYVNIEFSFDVVKYADGKRTSVPYSVIFNDHFDNGENAKELNIHLTDLFAEANQSSYVFGGSSIAHYENVRLSITPTSDDYVVLNWLNTTEPYFSNDYQEKAFNAQLAGIQNYKIVDNTADADFSSWIVTAVGGFMDFEVFPGLSIGATLFLVIGLGILMLILRLFAGG